jgi:RimJ/RimL family protein N-acetyltransferase
MSKELQPTQNELSSGRRRRAPHDDLVSTRLPVDIPARVALPGRTVLLEPTSHAHDATELWAETHGDPERAETWRFLSYGPFASLDPFDEWFAQATESNDPMWFTAIDAASERPIGMATLMRITPEHGVIEIGNIWFVPEARGTTQATEAVFVLMRHAMEAGYRRLEWKCDAGNVRSRRAALRFGFRFEGIFANHMVIKGRNRDTAWYSITKEEWSTLRPVLDDWLDPYNFDGTGSALTSLREATQRLW